MDLDSTNGTYLNGLRLSPHKVHSVAHGDSLTLGELHLTVSIRSIESA